ncbi:MAG TPA: twin-arginine translocation signal domain-containing protein [Pseudonocardiaceae bacterium]
MARDSLSRRDLLRGAALLTAAGGLSVVLPGTAWAARDYTSRATFDALDQAFNNGNGRKDELNENRGALAWDEAYFMQAYLMMYQAYRDRYYLDKAIDHIDHVLANRDSERGVTVWTGRSEPAWRAGTPYSAGQAVLRDADGKPVLRITTTSGNGSDLRVSVEPGTTSGTFRIVTSLTGSSGSRVFDSHDNLVMDRSSANHPTRRMEAVFANSTNETRCTAEDLRPADAGVGPAPAYGNFTGYNEFFHTAVHTGQIAYPIAKCARLIIRDPELWADSYYRAKAEEYFAAAEAAARVHDREYNVNADGEGYYRHPKGDPVALDNIGLPHNYNTSMARVWIELYRARNIPEHGTRATQLLTTWHNDLELASDGTAPFHYYWTRGYGYTGWSTSAQVSLHTPSSPGNKRYEDIGHAYLSITAAYEAREMRMVVTNDTMRRLANTFNRRILYTAADGKPSAHRYVNGTDPGDLSPSLRLTNELISAAWLGIYPYDPEKRMLNGVLNIYNALGDLEPSTLLIHGTAWLNWAARQG